MQIENENTHPTPKIMIRRDISKLSETARVLVLLNAIENDAPVNEERIAEYLSGMDGDSLAIAGGTVNRRAMELKREVQDMEREIKIKRERMERYQTTYDYLLKELESCRSDRNRENRS